MATPGTGWGGLLRTKSVEQSIRDTDIPILPVLACLWLMLNLSVETWLRFLIWMALGLIVYFAYSRRHSVLGNTPTASPTDEAPPPASIATRE